MKEYTFEEERNLLFVTVADETFAVPDNSWEKQNI